MKKYLVIIELTSDELWTVSHGVDCHVKDLYRGFVEPLETNEEPVVQGWLKVQKAFRKTEIEKRNNESKSVTLNQTEEI